MLPHYHTKGFSLIELMITLAIIAIVANMAITSFVDYQIRSKIGSGLALASTAKLGVSESFAYDGSMPLSNAEAGLPSPSSISGNYVSSIAVGNLPAPGSITITYKQFSRINSGDSLLLVPDPQGGSVEWNCSSSDLQSNYLPSICR